MESEDIQKVWNDRVLRVPDECIQPNHPRKRLPKKLKVHFATFSRLEISIRSPQDLNFPDLGTQIAVGQ